MLTENLLVDIRKDNALTIRAIADILGVSKSTYSRWETGEKIIPTEHLVMYCNYFKVSMDFVFGLDRKNNYKLLVHSANIVANNLKEFRKKFKLTQVDVATFLNSNQSAISSYEKAKVVPQTLYIYSLARNFNISMDSFFIKYEN